MNLELHKGWTRAKRGQWGSIVAKRERRRAMPEPKWSVMTSAGNVREYVALPPRVKGVRGVVITHISTNIVICDNRTGIA